MPEVASRPEPTAPHSPTAEPASSATSEECKGGASASDATADGTGSAATPAGTGTGSSSSTSTLGASTVGTPSGGPSGSPGTGLKPGGSTVGKAAGASGFEGPTNPNGSSGVPPPRGSVARTPRQAVAEAQRLLEIAEKRAAANKPEEAFGLGIQALDTLAPHKASDGECRQLAEQIVGQLEAWGEQTGGQGPPARNRPLIIR